MVKSWLVLLPYNTFPLPLLTFVLRKRFIIRESQLCSLLAKKINACICLHILEIQPKRNALHNIWRVKIMHVFIFDSFPHAMSSLVMTQFSYSISFLKSLFFLWLLHWTWGISQWLQEDTSVPSASSSSRTPDRWLNLGTASKQGFHVFFFWKTVIILAFLFSEIQES